MNNDLISREALKKAFKEKCCGECDNCGLSCDLIDNAPTVEERPQGKWIGVVYSNNRLGVGMCNQCGVNRIVDNFCSNCGADMRGTNEE